MFQQMKLFHINMLRDFCGKVRFKQKFFAPLFFKKAAAFLPPLAAKYTACSDGRRSAKAFAPSTTPKVLMSNTPVCPQCTLENTYPDGGTYMCADCGYEWPMAQTVTANEEDAVVVKDSNGNKLADGDSVVLIKDLKVKGSSVTLKVGTKVKSIRLVGGDHEVDCKMEAGNFMLKACYLRKV